MSMMKDIVEQTVATLKADHFGRPAGSGITGMGTGDIISFLSSTEMVDVTDTLADDCKGPGCSYYRFEIPANMEAYQAAVLLEDIPADKLQSIRVQIGHHGNPELVCDAIGKVRVNHGHMIVGKHEGKDVVYTWYPGDVTPFVALKRATAKLG